MAKIVEVYKNPRKAKRPAGLSILCIVLFLRSLFVFASSLLPFILILISDSGLSTLSSIFTDPNSFALQLWALSRPFIHLVYFYLVLSLWNLRKNSLNLATALYVVEFLRGVGEVIISPPGTLLESLLSIAGWMALPTIALAYIYSKRNILTR